ncbi:MAG: ABC transporter ATP-binding protein [Thermodesulfobacteriota bacterium]
MDISDIQEETVVEVRNLTKEFNGVRAVDAISFDVYGGEILGILGPNGAGKTTTLQMLLGVTTPTGGRIRLFGLDSASHREEILKRVNFSSSYLSMPYSLTVFENLLVFAGLYGIDRPRERIVDLLRTFEIEELRNQTVRKLSSGQVTRIGLAKALLNEPTILFLDEPTASLDPDMADKTRRLLRWIRDERGISIIYTSHNMREMEEMSDRLIFLDRGRIIAEGRPDRLLDTFAGKDLEELFLKVARGEFHR